MLDDILDIPFTGNALLCVQDAPPSPFRYAVHFNVFVERQKSNLCLMPLLLQLLDILYKALLMHHASVHALS